MELKEAIRILNWSQQQMRLGNLPDYSQNVNRAIRTVLQALEVSERELKGAREFINEEEEAIVERNNKICELEYELKNCISKDKIKEKITKIENKLDNEEFTHDMLHVGTEVYGSWTRLQAQRRVLEELLKGE